MTMYLNIEDDEKYEMELVAYVHEVVPLLVNQGHKSPGGFSTGDREIETLWLQVVGH